YIGVGSGSDQIIELLLSTLAGGRGSRAAVFVPTFSYFINRCELHGIRVDRVPLDRNFELDEKAFARRARKADLVYLCSPNNPTGNQIPKEKMERMMDLLDGSRGGRGGQLVLVDEAYADFAGYSLAKEATRRDNVIVLRTLSKAFGLAGARVGYMIAGEEIASTFRSTIQSPYPVSTLSLAIATKVLDRAAHVRQTIEEVRAERARMLERLSGMDSVKAYRSDANFLFVELGGRKRYRAAVDELAKDGVLVKLVGNGIDGHRGCMRVGIGTREMNGRFLSCIERAVVVSRHE
ncbi:MAG: histidinol-phosphate transaminase, partial [Nitrososphaera sp.]